MGPLGILYYEAEPKNDIENSAYLKVRFVIQSEYHLSIV